MPSLHILVCAGNRQQDRRAHSDCLLSSKYRRNTFCFFICCKTQPILHSRERFMLPCDLDGSAALSPFPPSLHFTVTWNLVLYVESRFLIALVLSSRQEETCPLLPPSLFLFSCHSSPQNIPPAPLSPPVRTESGILRGWLHVALSHLGWGKAGSRRLLPLPVCRVLCLTTSGWHF